MVLEDDFVLTDNFETILKCLLREFTKWDFIRLQGLYEVPYLVQYECLDFMITKNIGDAVGATAYLLKPAVAAQLLKCSENIYEPVDHFLEHHQKHGLDFLAIRPYPVDISRAKTTIDDRLERSPVKGLKKRLRSLLRAIDRLISKNPWFPK